MGPKRIIRSTGGLGDLIRARRRERKLTQAELAKRAGVSRQWIIGVEQGKPSAEFGLVLQALAAVGLQLEVGAPQALVDGYRILERLLREGPL